MDCAHARWVVHSIKRLVSLMLLKWFLSDTVIDASFTQRSWFKLTLSVFSSCCVHNQLGQLKSFLGSIFLFIIAFQTRFVKNKTYRPNNNNSINYYYYIIIILCIDYDESVMSLMICQCVRTNLIP